MSFDTFTPRKRLIAEESIKLIRRNYGGRNLKIQKEISPDIPWRPSYHIKPKRSLIIAVEVSELLYPEILKIAARPIIDYEYPIKVYLVCPLSIYTADKDLRKVNELKNDGFGIITVDDNRTAIFQHNCIPLAQHIKEKKLDEELRGLSPTIKTRFRSSYITYRANEGQGLQDASQIVESLIDSIVNSAVTRGQLNNSVISIPLASKVDELYTSNNFRDSRAVLGSVRGFVNEYRNIASHPPGSAREAMEKIKKCKDGFQESIRLSKKLCDIAKRRGYRIYLP